MTIAKPLALTLTMAATSAGSAFAGAEEDRKDLLKILRQPVSNVTISFAEVSGSGEVTPTFYEENNVEGWTIQSCFEGARIHSIPENVSAVTTCHHEGIVAHTTHEGEYFVYDKEMRPQQVDYAGFLGIDK